ncbi:cytoplasmic protein [Spongisporangium articulatum]|uniref:Cytoplasmic protein n=1 Tax=Spongisporangium articulatum TaxID=3362603 RepID=A0ABW8AR47_9ACTN
MSSDPVVCCPDLYSVVFENERVRVLEYRDVPGDRTAPHRHPDSVMVSLAAFSRQVSAGGRSVDVELAPGEVRWVAAQEHVGENTGTTPSWSVFVELKEGAGGLSDALGPDPR